jgi:uncharacterized protein
MDEALAQKLTCLESELAGIGDCLVAYSGGVDSTLLLAVAARQESGRVLAVTVSSPFVAADEVEDALRLAEGLGVEHIVIEVPDLLEMPELKDNPPDRCYHCKKGIMAKLALVAKERGIATIIEGSNSDDSGQYRPGKAALKESGVLSPMERCGLTKAEVRALSRHLGLPTWDKPAMACLATRFPYGTELELASLEMVARAEGGLRELGITDLRLRCHGDIARIEVPPSLFASISTELRQRVVELVKEAGFSYVTLDLEGYRFGAMDEKLEDPEKAK